MKMRFIWVLCLILGCCGIGNAQYKANYQLAEKFREFALGGKMTKNSLSIHPKFIRTNRRYPRCHLIYRLFGRF